MPLVSGDLAQYCLEGAQGRLRPELITFDRGWSVCVILASAGYPATSRRGDGITGLADVSESRIFHCGTRRNAQGDFETNGGRVLAVVAQAPTKAEARSKAYASVGKINFPGAQRRTDIAK